MSLPCHSSTHEKAARTASKALVAPVAPGAESHKQIETLSGRARFLVRA